MNEFGGWRHKLFVSGALIGILGWIVLLLLYTFWMLQPTGFPNVKEPLPVLNQNKEVGVGETLIVQLDVEKTAPLAPISSTRYLSCESGNLVTLTGSPTRLPLGKYTLIVDDIKIPNKILPNDTCVFEIVVLYQINPVRQEELTLTSEVFTVTE